MAGNNQRTIILSRNDFFTFVLDICHQVLDLYSSKQKKATDGDSPPQSPAKGTKQQSSSPPPPPPPPLGDRTLNKRSREVIHPWCLLVCAGESVHG